MRLLGAFETCILPARLSESKCRSGGHRSLLRVPEATSRSRGTLRPSRAIHAVSHIGCHTRVRRVEARVTDPLQPEVVVSTDPDENSWCYAPSGASERQRSAVIAKQLLCFLDIYAGLVPVVLGRNSIRAFLGIPFISELALCSLS